MEMQWSRTDIETLSPTAAAGETTSFRRYTPYARCDEGRDSNACSGLPKNKYRDRFIFNPAAAVEDLLPLCGCALSAHFKRACAGEYRYARHPHRISALVAEPAAGGAPIGGGLGAVFLTP